MGLDQQGKPLCGTGSKMQEARQAASTGARGRPDRQKGRMKEVGQDNRKEIQKYRNTTGGGQSGSQEGSKG